MAIDFIVILGLILHLGCYVCYIGDIVTHWIVKLGFCSIHFTVTLAGLNIWNTVVSKIVILGFHCKGLYYGKESLF